MRLRYTERAKDDVELAFEWYEKQRKGLGFEFLDCVEISINNILSFPEMYKICYLVSERKRTFCKSAMAIFSLPRDHFKI